MQNTFYAISGKDLFDLFGRLAATHKVFVPYRKGEGLNFDVFDAAREVDIELGSIRQSQPAKSFIAQARERVTREAPKSSKPVILAGVKACDLASLAIQDHVFLKTDPEDPFYSQNRKNTTIISCDCTNAKETCFCLAMDGAPYANTGFDINLSPVGDGFLAEVITPKGTELVSRFRMFFKPGTSRDAEIRESGRKKVVSEVRSFIEKRETPGTGVLSGAVAKTYNDSAMWQEFASTCVECGACNLVCPTCHCFLLFDERDNVKSDRYRIWDSCLYNTFARVAGGANPRRHLWERLRNRFDKKFAFFPEIVNKYACTGCGRCIEACPGDIDIREVLKGLVKGKWEKPPHK